MRIRRMSANPSSPGAMALTRTSGCSRAMRSKASAVDAAAATRAPFSSKAVIDACRPWDHLHEFPAVAEASKELQEKTRAKWKDLL